MPISSNPLDDDEYYSDDEGVHKPPPIAPEVNWDQLAEWLDKMYPKVKQALDANLEQRAFDNYEVKWEEEREDINELHILRTNFNFIEANMAV